jgi:hypothetical protein
VKVDSSTGCDSNGASLFTFEFGCNYCTVSFFLCMFAVEVLNVARMGKSLVCSEFFCV